MSDNRKRPCIYRVLPEVDARVRAYAARQGLAPNVAAEALINGAAAEIAALGDEVAWHKQREKDIVTACERVADGGQFRADIIGAIHRIKDERDAAIRAAEALRADLESAREATRRADAEVESSHRSNRILALRADAAEAEVARLTREVGEARRAADKLRIEVQRVTEERDTAATARAANEQRTAVEPCACALPAVAPELAARAEALAHARDEHPDALIRYCIALGVSRLESLRRHAPVQSARDKAKREARRT